MNIFNMLTPASYWILIVIWTLILFFYLRRLISRKVPGKLFNILLIILAIDAFRTLFESVYFGAWYTSRAGFLPIGVHDFLVQPQYVIIPKFLNVVAAALVVLILLRRWLPAEEQEKKQRRSQLVDLENEVAARKKMAEKLHDLNLALENRVEQRTRDLKKEIFQRKRTELLLRSVFDGVTEPLLLLDNDLYVLIANKAALEYYDSNKMEDFRALKCFEPITGESDPREGGEAPSMITKMTETAFKRKSPIHPGRLETVMVHPVRLDEDGPEAVIVRIMDVTGEKLLEKKLIQSEKLASIGVLVTGIAHEINNPNNFVTFNIPILREYLDEIMPIVDKYAEQRPDLEMFYMPYAEFREDVFKLLDNVEHGSRRIKSIVSDLKDFSRTKRKKKIERIDLRPVIEKVVTFCRSKIKRTVKTFEVSVPEGLPRVLIDPHSLEQVLINLLINAAQAFDKPINGNSMVALVVLPRDPVDGPLAIEVRDNGRGMDSETMDKIFDPFFTTKPPEEGTGLGMYIAHNLIENMGGRIEVESAPGKGSRVSVLLEIT